MSSSKDVHKSPFVIIKKPSTTEKSIRIMESENKLVFFVDKSARKEEIKNAVETAFNVKVAQVNTVITPQGEKKAYVKLTPEFLAMDLASTLGIM